MIRRIAVSTVLVALFALRVSAQEFDVFDLSDFVDPELRHVVFDERGDQVVERGNDFNIIRVATGRLGRYSSRSVPTKEDASFLHLVSSSYFGDTQANWKLTAFQPSSRHDSKLPLYRLSSQIGVYGVDRYQDRKSNSVQSLPYRAVFTFALEENRREVRDAGGRRFNREFAISSDSIVPLLDDSRLSGSTALVIRDTAGEKRLYRLAFMYRFGERVVLEHGRVGAGSSLGFEKAGAIRMSPFRANIWAAWDVPRVGTLNFTYTPTYQPAMPGRRVFNEVSIFIDRTLYSTPPVRTAPSPLEPPR